MMNSTEQRAKWTVEMPDYDVSFAPVITIGAFRFTVSNPGDGMSAEDVARLIVAAPAYAKAWELVPEDIKEQIFDTLHTMHDEWVTAAIKVEA